MRYRRFRLLAAVTFTIGAVFAAQGGVVPASAQGLSYSHLTPLQKRLASTELSVHLGPATAPAPRAAIMPGGGDAGGEGDLTPSDAPVDGSYTAAPAGASTGGAAYHPTGTGACSEKLGNNVKVNQNCLNLTDSDVQGRAQAHNETSVAQDPNHPDHLVASYNDYRRGDGNCYGAYSLDNGRSWNDTTIPMSFTRGRPTFGKAREYWQAGGDTSVAWDSKGNAYFSCQVFNRGAGVSPNSDQSSAFYVFRSTGNNGASWNFPGRPVSEFNDVAGAGTVLEDKQLLTVDNHRGSPFQDRVYVSWTEFAADGTAFIYEAYSKDYGETFSKRTLVSTTSPLCTLSAASNPSSKCDSNQFSQPFTASDGTLYVVYDNFNNAVAKGDNRNQVFISRSTDGGNTFGAPQKVSDYYDLPACAAYQGGKDFGRACVPEKGSSMNSFFRASNYPVGQVNPNNSKQVIVTFGSYINRNSQESNGCTPTGFFADGNNTFAGVKTAGACNNKILTSVSNDGGATYSGTATDPRMAPTVNPARAQARTDQWWQWFAMTKTGKLAVAYYDRQYGNDETTGYMDISLSGSDRPSGFGVKRVTSGSMPPPTEFGGVFFGDYNGLSALTDEAHPLWMDTRNRDVFLCPGTGTPGNPPRVCNATVGGPAFNPPLVANNEDAFTATLSIPGHDENGDQGGDNNGGGGGKH